MHEIRITNQPCDGNTAPIIVQIIDRDGHTRGQTHIGLGATATILLPAASYAMITEDIREHAAP